MCLIPDDIVKFHRKLNMEISESLNSILNFSIQNLTKLDFGYQPPSKKTFLTIFYLGWKFLRTNMNKLKKNKKQQGVSNPGYERQEDDEIADEEIICGPDRQNRFPWYVLLAPNSWGVIAFHPTLFCS